MGTHHAPQQPDGLGGLVGRGALTAVAALALAGGGAGVAFAGDAPTAGDQEAGPSADHGDDCSCDGYSDAPDWMSSGSDDDQDGPDSGFGTDDGDRGDGGNSGESGDRGSGTSHHPTRSHAPSTEKIGPGAGQGGATTVPIRSGVMH